MSVRPCALLGLLVTLQGVGCGTHDASPPAPTRVAAASPQQHVDEASAVPAAWQLPDGWFWETSTRAGFVAAFPALPTPEASTGRLVVRSAAAEYTIAVVQTGDPAPQYRREAEALGWSIASDRPGEHGRLLDVVHDGLVTHARTVVAQPRSFLLTTTAVTGSDPNAELFLRAFSPMPRAERRRIAVPGGGFSVLVPARVTGWRDASRSPPMRGVRGQLDGVQFLAAHADLPENVDPSVFLRSATDALVQTFGGTTVRRVDGTLHGAPSTYLEHRGATGVHVTRRVTAAHGRFIDVAVYAHSGTQPGWAREFVDSIALD